MAVRKVVVIVLSVLMVSGIAFADMTYSVKDGKAVIVDTLADQPVQARGQNGQIVNLPAKDSITRTYDPISKADASVQIIQLTEQKNKDTVAYNKKIANINGQIDLLRAIVAELPDEVEEVIGE
jgi:hypothetical protein